MDTGNDRTENGPPTKTADYLWDGSGEPDPEIQRLEALLGKFRHDCPAPVFPEIVGDRRWRFFPWRIKLFPALATTAVAVGTLVVVTFLVHGGKPTPNTEAGWDVSRVEGTPRNWGKEISGKKRTSPV